MIKIRVYPGPLCTSDFLDEDGCALVEEGTTVGDLLKKLACPRIVTLAGLYTLNHKRTKSSATLSQGDVLSILALPSGG